MNRHSFRAGLLALFLVMAGSLASQEAGAQNQNNGQRITPHFKDAEIGQVIEAVAAATGKTIIPDIRVRAQVTMLSNTPMTPSQFYEAFLALLQVHSFVAVESGGIIRIVPDANARQLVNQDLPTRINGGSEELVTQVIAVKNINASQLVPVLRPLQPQSAHLAAFPSSNILVISDRASNVNRIMRIIERIDQVGDSDVDIVRLEHASSSEVVRVVNTFFQQAQGGEGGGGQASRVIADDRSNSVLIGGDRSQRLRIKTLVAHLDTPLDNGGDTQVRYLQFADAEKIATKLKEQLSATVAITGAAPAGGAPSGVAASADRSTTIWAEPETNALVITAPAKVMRSLMAVVDKLDIRRLQVLVEAIIVDVTVNKNAELGVNWAVWSEDDDERIPLGLFNQQVGGVSVLDLAGAIDNPANTPSGIQNGSTFGIGRIASSGVNFAAMLRAIQGDSTTNVIATPSAVTMDNQEAELKVAQEVPFVTGSYTNTGGNNNGNVNPFTTVQREEVGTILKITPKINQGGDLVQLKIELESSELTGDAGDANSLITNKRTVNTNVLIEDGGIVVLGGLIRDGATRGEQRVPYLGRIPILGELFKTRTRRRDKTNLMVFIRPKVLMDGQATAFATDAKYNFMRQLQKEASSQKGEVLPLIPFNKDPMLPTIPPPTSAPSVLPPESTVPPESKTDEQSSKPQP